MADLFWLTDAQMERLKPFFPPSHGVPRVDDKRVLSGIIFINRNGLRWRDAPAEYGPHKTRHNRWVRWSRLGVFTRILTELAAEGRETDVIMIDVEPVFRHWSKKHWRGHLKAHRTASSLRGKKGAQSGLSGGCEGEDEWVWGTHSPRILTELAAEGRETDVIMIDVEPVFRHWSKKHWRGHLKAHRTASCLRGKKGARAVYRADAKGRTNGSGGPIRPEARRAEQQLHTVCDAKGRPLAMCLSAGQTSDYIGARVLLHALPPAGALLADKGYDADWSRNALIERNIQPCIPPRRGRKTAASHDVGLFRKRHKIENMFAKLKDWRRISTRHDRCADQFLSACALAATVMFWL
jgi:transposase